MNQICYVITIAKNFPATHPKAGEPTDFHRKIKAYDKTHTIRANYELWKKRFEKIDRGEAYLSVREWIGKPYASKQKELFRFSKEDGISIEKLEIKGGICFINGCHWNGDLLPDLAVNDGLSLDDFKSWFSIDTIPEEKAFAIIHFTNFSYELPF